MTPTLVVTVDPGLPSFTLINAPDEKNTRVRDDVRALMRDAGWTYPLHRITVDGWDTGQTHTELVESLALLIARLVRDDGLRMGTIEDRRVRS